jgi:hypothetical protein
MPKVWRTGVKASRTPEGLAPIVLLPVLLGQLRPLPVQRQVRRSGRRMAPADQSWMLPHMTKLVDRLLPYSVW